MKSCYEVIPPKTVKEDNLPPIILLHALFNSKEGWEMVAPVIAEKTSRKVFALDARNHGQSSWSTEMNFDVLVKDVLEFMDDLHIQKAVFVGHSMGGRTAMNIALKHPEKVSALIVEDMTPNDVVSEPLQFIPTLIQAGIEALRNFSPDMDLEEAKREFLEMIISLAGEELCDAERVRRNCETSPIPIIKVGKSFFFQCNVDVLLEVLQANLLVQNLLEENLSFDGNVMFLYGSKPFYNLGKDPSIRKMFPRAIVRKVEGASHMMHFDSPEEFSEIVSDFILLTSAPRSKY